MGLAAGIKTGQMTGLKGRDLLSHISSSAYKNVKSGITSGKQGISKWGGSMLEGTANSFVDANHVFNSGGYGNFLKGKMLQRVGYDKFDAKQGERLTDAVKTATSLKEKYQGYASSVGGLNDKAYQSFAQSLMQQGSAGLRSKGEKLLRAHAIYKSGGSGVSEKDYQDAMDIVRDHETAIEDFYNTGFYGHIDLTSTPGYESLDAIKTQISKEINDVKDSNGNSISVNAWGDISNAEAVISTKISESDKVIDQAEKDLKDFKNTERHKNVNMDNKNGRYRS